MIPFRLSLLKRALIAQVSQQASHSRLTAAYNWLEQAHTLSIVARLFYYMVVTLVRGSSLTLLPVKFNNHHLNSVMASILPTVGVNLTRLLTTNSQMIQLVCLHTRKKMLSKQKGSGSLDKLSARLSIKIKSWWFGY